MFGGFALLKSGKLFLVGLLKPLPSLSLCLEHRPFQSLRISKEAESIFYHFIWNGKDKVKRNAAISEVENGGLNMLDTESMIRTKRVICLQKCLEDHESPWKMFLGELLKPVGGKFLLHCNFEVSKLNISMPAMSCCMVRIKRKRT